jgi:thiol-disulfide isomerase/thioredoxin
MGETKETMIPLPTQELFEQLIGRVPSETPLPSFAIVYFTAEWCKACKRLDFAPIFDTVPKATWYKCDVDVNEYTLGYCGLRSLPSFLVIKDTKILGTLSDSRTEKVIEWLKRFV